MIDTKYEVVMLNVFQKKLNKAIRQGKKIDKLKVVIEKLANRETLDLKYRDHKLVDNKEFKNCRECHLEPDWLLIYKYHEEKLILLLIDTGSHSDLFR